MRRAGFLALVLLLSAGASLSPTACNPEPGETTMDLELKLELDREEYLYGESILPRLTLSNTGKDPVEAPSLSFNDSVVGLTILDESGAEIGTYRRYHFEARRGRERPSFDNLEMIALAAGESDRAEKRFLLYRDPLPPGRYSFVARYDWVDTQLRSEAVDFVVHPSRPRLAALGWDRQFTHPYHLLYAWTEVWNDSPVLLQAGTFNPDPSIVYFASRVEIDATEPIEDLHVARNLVEPDGYQSTLLWKSGDHLFFRPMGEVDDARVSTVAPDLPGWSIVAAPHRDARGVTMALLTNSPRTEVLALALDPDGAVTDLGRHETAPARLQAFVHSVLYGAVYVYVADTAETSQLRAARFGDEGSHSTVWESPRPIVAMATAVNRQEEASVVVASLEEKPGAAPRLHTRVFQGPMLKEENVGPSFELPPDAEPQLGLGADGAVHLLARTAAGHYLYASNGQPLREVDLEGLTSVPQLVVGFKEAAFVMGITRDRGVALRTLDPTATTR